MAGGLTYTAVDSTSLSTAEIYGKALVELGREHPEVVALTADLAKSTKIGDFMKEFPERFFNVGIAEQNLLGVAAGMAKSGLVPFASTFSQFASFRAADQLHTDICYQNVNVKVIATHSGTSFGQAGSTHHAICDLAVTRSIPNLTVIVPADGVETYNAVMAAYETPGPFYIRINRGFDRVLYKDSNYGFEVGKAVTVKEGTDITVIACGSCVFQALQAAEFLEKTDGLKVRVLDMHTIKPIDKEAIQKAVFETRRIITVEDHNILGGLGSAVAEVVVDYGKACAFKKLGIPDKFAPIGLHEDIMSIVGIDSNGIIEAVREVMGKDFELDDDWDDEV
ncbi:MAG TPA: transketolase C-terminal domain-containing protein [Clostridiales bacterium]|jgi:transketolase|nr:transketolase C-terminal domain-containing protein [Clostridiales bacterium]HOJ36209.1 transketolase C-terminal domain-containing protein [Clostridiales bacterium]HOL79060.1 transketolase C-terminal domain-containing protein [Clostridiales bacterium]HPP68090.1 transketolase C-terminal domain-containing protein [Clostridiales bacterium]HPU67610.1 transketolase C-terminal domain-containing protein [Clostridiales bacterium]